MRGKKTALLAHLLGHGKGPCIHASAEAIAAATELKLSTSLTVAVGAKRGHALSAASSVPDLSMSEPLSKKLQQTSLVNHTYRGIDMPFSHSEIAAVQAQAL